MCSCSASPRSCVLALACAGGAAHRLGCAAHAGCTQGAVLSMMSLWCTEGRQWLVPAHSQSCVSSLQGSPSPFPSQVLAWAFFILLSSLCSPPAFFPRSRLHGCFWVVSSSSLSHCLCLGVHGAEAWLRGLWLTDWKNSSPLHTERGGRERGETAPVAFGTHLFLVGWRLLLSSEWAEVLLVSSSSWSLGSSSSTWGLGGVSGWRPPSSAHSMPPR